VVGGPLLIAAGFLGRGSGRIGRIDWTAGRKTAVRQATATLSRITSGGQALLRELRARRRPRPSTPGRRKARRLNEHAAALRNDGRAREALEPIEQALEIVRALGDRHGEAFTLNGLGLTQARLGDEAGALDSYEKAVALLSELGDGHGAGRVLANLGALHRGQGHEEEARATWNEALERLEPGTPEHDRTAAQLRLAS
ncbi:MAG: tetratricopeptide repeat protein, partial [Gaiellaceae bacterium]